MKSLQTSLLELIRENYPQEVSIDKLYMLCEMLDHKQSTCDRKCRVLTHAGLITPILTDKHAIKAYVATSCTKENMIDLNKYFLPKEQGRLGITLPRINL